MLSPALETKGVRGGVSVQGYNGQIRPDRHLFISRPPPLALFTSPEPRSDEISGLELFQFDYDLTFAAFFLNADKTIYG